MLSINKELIIQGFLLPIWEFWYESTNGPIINFSAHGNEAIEVIIAISVIEKFLDAIQSIKAK